MNNVFASIHSCDRRKFLISLQLQILMFGCFIGFLKPGTTGNTASNFGLLDQIAALQWVKDNIAAFGGDVGKYQTHKLCSNPLEFDFRVPMHLATFFNIN